MIQIVLIEPKTPGNIGAIARSMKNFGFNKLILINPKIKHNTKEEKDRATHAKEILQKAQTSTFKEICDSSDLVIGSTAIKSKDTDVKRTMITPMQLQEKLKNKKGKISIVLGREANGLTNKEIEQCDLLINIPTNSKHRALNLAHAATIIMYELSKNIKGAIKLATKKQKQVLYQKIQQKINSQKTTKQKKRQTNTNMEKNHRKINNNKQRNNYNIKDV